ncbi:MAG: alpha/beta hydrolase [Chloroflexi bacterium]|nr:alpha/beta hydrolase [Chloroflexota bacterium]
MVETQFVQSKDGTRIAYDVTGKETDPALLLVHGYSDDRQLNWHMYGWPERLGADFRVVTVDLRGCGESDAYRDPDRYKNSDYLDDLLAVMDAAGAEQYLYWGWSFGGMLGLHLAAYHTDRLVRLVGAGTAFGPGFPADVVTPVIELWEQLVQIQDAGDYEKIAPEEREWFKQVDAHAVLTRWQATLTHNYSGVEPDLIKVPTLIYTGEKDENVIGEMQQRRADMDAAGIQFHVFDGLDHVNLLSEVDTVLPLIRGFLLAD